MRLHKLLAASILMFLSSCMIAPTVKYEDGVIVGLREIHEKDGGFGSSSSSLRLCIVQVDCETHGRIVFGGSYEACNILDAYIKIGSESSLPNASPYGYVAERSGIKIKLKLLTWTNWIDHGRIRHEIVINE